MRAYIYNALVLLKRIDYSLTLAALFVFALPIAGQAQYTYTTNSPDTNTITITGYTGPGGSVAIPSNILGKTVTQIGFQAFFICASLTNLMIPDSVINIEQQAFCYCTNLINATVGNNVIRIGDSAFNHCTSLTNITILGNVTSIGEGAFYECFSLADFTIGTSVTNLGHSAFSRCISLTGVTIPDNVITIGAGAFSYCTSLTNATIGNGISTIDFLGYCDNLTSVTIGSGVSIIWPGAFRDCKILTAIEVVAGNPTLSSSNGVVFNKNQSALILCPESVTGNFTVPDTVTRIEDWAFSYCASLTSITIPNSVSSIGEYAFHHCASLASVIFPDSVTNIGGCAFSSCGNGMNVYFKGNAPTVGSEAFNSGNMTVYYLPGTTGWPTAPAVWPDEWCGRPTALWLPEIQAEINFGIQGGNFGFNINWTSGMVVMVEACTNMNNPIWVPVVTHTLYSETSYFGDPQWTNHARRFYRLSGQ